MVAFFNIVIYILINRNLSVNTANYCKNNKNYFLIGKVMFSFLLSIQFIFKFCYVNNHLKHTNVLLE